MSRDGLIWRYKVTIFFILTYWLLDPILYFYFGNAYISGSADENKWLVFLAGPFSFSEDFSAGTPFLKALKDAMVSGNFWVPFAVIFATELRIPGGFKIGYAKFSMGTSYLFGVFVSYITSACYWHFYYKHIPSPGTSIIGFSLTIVYWFFSMLLFAMRLKPGRTVEGALKVLGGIVISFFGISIALIGYLFGNGAAPIHILGFLFFISISLSASPLLKINGPDLARREKVDTLIE